MHKNAFNTHHRLQEDFFIPKSVRNGLSQINFSLDFVRKIPGLTEFQQNERKKPDKMKSQHTKLKFLL